MVNRFVLTLNTCGCVAVLLILVGALSMSGYNNGYEGAGGLPPGEEDVRGAGDSSCAEIRKLAALHPRMALPPRCRVLGQGQGMRDGFRTNVVVSQMPGMDSINAMQDNYGYIGRGFDLGPPEGINFPELVNQRMQLGARCFHSCETNPKCVAYTFHPSDGTCFLKARLHYVADTTCGKGNDCWFWGKVKRFYQQ